MARRGGKRGGDPARGLSRDERSAIGAQTGFASVTDRAMMECPDCRDNELGDPNMPRSKKVASIAPTRSARTCATCRGYRWVPRPKEERIDPYATNLQRHS